MKNKFVYFILLLLYCYGGGNVTLAHQSNNNLLLSLADSLYKYENFYDSITEYKRFLMFHPKDTMFAYTHYKLGLAYQQYGDLQSSKESFLKSIEYSNNEKLINNNRISLAISCIATKNYKFALLELQKIIMYGKDQYLIKKALFFRILTYLYMENWLQARSAFRDFTKYFSADNITAQTLDSLLLGGIELHYKSPQNAALLSTFLPGAGQFYTQNYWDSINAFMLNGLNISFAYYLMVNSYYLDAGLFILYFGLRYYQGNIYNAKNEAIDYNQNLLNKHKNLCIQYLLKISENL